MHPRSGLRTPRPPDGRRGDDEVKNEGRTRRVSGGSSSPKKDSSTSQTLVSRRGVKNKQPSQEVSVSEQGNPQQHSIHSRIGRSSSIEDSYWSRNWNSEGGRPKRERALSDRPQSKRLLQRASVTSVGELIPFQRAPRDGSYESNLPHRRKTETNKRQIEQDDRKELSSLEHRDTSKSNEPQKSNSDAVPNPSVGRQRKQGTNQSKGTHLRNKDAKENTVHPSRKQSSGKGSVEVVPREPPQIGSLRNCTITDTNNSAEEIESSDGVLTGVKSSNIDPPNNNVAISLLEQHGGDDLSSQRTRDETPRSSGRRSIFQSSRTVSVEHWDDGESSNSRVTANVNSPSAEFKQAAAGQQRQTRNSSTSSSQPTASQTNSVPSTNLIPLNFNNISSPVSSTSSDVGHPEELSPRLPNSVLRRGRDSSSISEPNPAQSSQTRGEQSLLSSSPRQTAAPNPAALRESPRTIMPHPPRMSTSQTSETRRDQSLSANVVLEAALSDSDVISASPRTNIAHPPTATIPPSLPSGPNATSSQQGRLNRFGRRVRVPSSSEPQESSNRPSQEEISHSTSSEQTPVNETSEGTNRQRYRFFTLSGDRANEENRRSAISLTPHRDALYGSASPPLLRRHMRTHFDSDHRETPRGSHGSVGIRSSLGSSISDDDLLREDSFRTSSGGRPLFSPVLNSGPSLDGSSSVQRRQVLVADASISPRELSSLNSSPRELSRLSSPSREVSPFNSSPRGLPLLNSSSRSHIRTRGEMDIDSSSDPEYLTFSVDEGRLGRDARRRHQNDRSDAIPRLLPQRSRETSRELTRSTQIMNDVFGSNTNQRASNQSTSVSDASSDLQVPLFGSPLFAPLGVPPGMLLSLLVRTRREYGQEFMELLLENMMLNVLAHHLFETDLQGNDNGISGAPPPATQDIIDNLKETPALEMHIAKEMKCSICHSEYELYETLAELPCTHFFHPTCVAVWLKKSGTCPVCRFDLTSPTK